MENSLHFWQDVFTRNLSDVLTRPVDMNSQHLVRDKPLRMDRSLIADFTCDNRLPRGRGLCGRKWDSTSITVTFLYSINSSRNHRGIYLNYGEIEIEQFGQKCQRCRKSSNYAMPSFDIDSADRAATKLKQKILEKFYGENIPDQPLTSHGRRERKKPHDMDNCEACSRGVCAALEGRGGFEGTGRLPSRRRQVDLSGPTIEKWVIQMTGSGEKVTIGMEQGNNHYDDNDDGDYYDNDYDGDNYENNDDGDDYDDDEDGRNDYNNDYYSGGFYYEDNDVVLSERMSRSLTIGKVPSRKSTCCIL